MVRSMNELVNGLVLCPRSDALLVDRRRGAALLLVAVATDAGEG
jgi:hypothetical protein